MSVAVSAVSLLVAGLGIAKLSSPAIDAWSDGKELAFGAIVVTVITLSYLTARMLARRVSEAVTVPLEAA
jgi:high-affinity nickel-transport protein